MAYLKQHSQLKGINWSRSYLWDVQFPDAPAPFKDWFPANDYTENLMSGMSFVTPTYNTEIKFPQSKSSNDCSFTFYDSVENVLYEWLFNWYREIYDTSKGTMMLSDAVKELRVAKLSLNREFMTINSYLVYPDGSMAGTFNSQSDVKMYSATFVIAGSEDPRG